MLSLKGMESNPKLQLNPPRTQWGGRYEHDVSEGKALIKSDDISV
jgi:hypothetical protein